ncbi:demethoxyubiquinone hydroxylase family protein [Saccharobesus litoralis]|uniref:Demethoxyubiquinone hydroxylase family protein n=1 Tax=Saccharobesus litoralis TaxID=2172099 RepID=A0A2S0VMP9_9ALTE|nr:demethoxyubiquinone hydroxylase family protein [Saccharobesus litoralis]AWB65380.1 demethoxyubiquinone hydroxylase family protein [Saccharobesus litoralis]
MSSKEVARIIRVDHAGEYGAISIYSAQLFIAKFFYRDIVNQLQEMLQHEKQHFSTFDDWLKCNNTRPCYALWLWPLGGYILGLVTGLLGRKSIWVCTGAVESTVLHHLDGQLNYLSRHSKSAYQTVLSIKKDEEEHLNLGLQKGSDSIVYLPIQIIVKYSTKFAIWLSMKL